MTSEEKAFEVESLSILRLIKDAQQKHGLRQGNYLRYRGYCGRRLRRLRRSLKFTHMHKSVPKRSARFVHRPVTADVVNDQRFLEILIFQTERHWAYAMHLKLEIGDDLTDRRKFHMRQRLRRAAKSCTALANVARRCEIFGVSTKLEAQAYATFMKANLYVEFRQWEKALTSLSTARKIYQRFSDIHQSDSTNIYSTRCQEIDNLIRLCSRISTGEHNAEILVKANAADEEMLDLDFNKLSVARAPEKKESGVIAAVADGPVKLLEPMPSKPMFFDISREYKNMIKS